MSHDVEKLWEVSLSSSAQALLADESFELLVEELLEVSDLPQLHDQIGALSSALISKYGPLEQPSEDPIHESPSFRDAGFLFRSLPQVSGARTLERARYYLKRTHKALRSSRTNSVNDIDLNRWHDYGHLYTDSLWLMDRRDSSGAHSAGYWGNFVPQIPNQLIQRFTKQGEWVLDPFCGSGTSLIEAQRLGRNALGVELQPDVVHLAREAVESEPNIGDVRVEVRQGDSTTFDFSTALQELGAKAVSLALLHPPYHDIIRFSESPSDLSNAPSEEAFTDQMGAIVSAVHSVLKKDGHLGLVIGDKYESGKLSPLGFTLMAQAQNLGFTLKSIVVKNFEGTSAKRGQEALWRYRALVGGFFVFKHEYIFLFKRT